MELEAVAAALAPRLIAYALGRTGCRSTAEDIAQDALMALVRRWRTTGPPESPEAYVFAIAKRRATRAVALRLVTTPLHLFTGIVRDEPTVEEAYEARNELALVTAALRVLSRRDREALLLRVAGELSVEQTAALLHTTPAAVKMRVSRARRRLAARMLEHSDGRRRTTV